MAQHFTRSTVSASAWCTKCQRNTQHRVDDRRIGPCLDCLDKQNQEHERTTEAQFTLCRQHLQADRCPICGRIKENKQCFCRHCYFALPEDLRRPLWIERTDRKALIEWAQNYTAAKDWLRRRGMDEHTGNLFAELT